MKNILDTLVLLGAFQGLIIGVLLFRKKEISNRLLGLMLLAFSLACTNIFLMESGIFKSSTFWMVFEATIPMIIIMPIGPLLYFYTKSTLKNGFSFRKNDIIHFFPIILDLAPNLFAIIYIFGAFLELADIQNQAVWGNVIDNFNKYVDIPRWISVSIFIHVSQEDLSTFT